MGGFSPEWLALREPIDHQSRNAELGRQLSLKLAGRGDIHVTDLGCGTGSNLRATAPLLGARQRWRLVDHEPELLAAARETLITWAGNAVSTDRGARLTRDGRDIEVEFVQADLANRLDAALGPHTDLITASALFDLASPAFMQRVTSAAANRGAALYAVLTYNGEQAWTPAHPSDGAMRAAFHRHQARDKGFGPAAGPHAAAELMAPLREAGFLVQEGPSPWILDRADAKLIDELADGYAAAVRETGLVARDDVSRWRSVRRTGAVVGHTDVLALPFRE